MKRKYIWWSTKILSIFFRWNDIEHFWSYLTMKHRGLEIPGTLPEMNDDGRTEEDAKNYVIDQGIEQLMHIDHGLAWDGHKVNPIGVFSGTTEVLINGQTIANDAFGEELFNHRKKCFDMAKTYDHMMSVDKEFVQDTVMFNKHYDRRSHFFMVSLTL